MRGYWCLCLLAASASFAATEAPRTRYRIETVAGSDRKGDGGIATSAQFAVVQGIAVDRLGNIYISDTESHRVRKVSAAGIVTTVMGTGTAGYSGDGGPAVAAQLNLPYGLAVDSTGSLYIADLGNQRVRRVGPDGTITTVAGTGRKASSGDDGTAVLVPLMSPRNVAVDGAGNLYISEFEGHRVRRVTPDGRIATVAGTGVAGFSGDGFPARSAQLGFPAGLAVDRFGALYVCDSQNHRIRRILPGGVITTVVGGAPGTAIQTPTSVTVDGFNNIFVGDWSAAVRQYTAAGVWKTFAGTGEAGFDGDGGAAFKARLSAVHDLTVDLSGSLLIADGVRVRKVSAAGVITTLAGDGLLKSIGDGGQALSALLQRPAGLALDTAGNLYVADRGTQRVRQISRAGNITTFAGTGQAGYDAAQLIAGATPLNGPQGLALDPSGILLIADTGNHRVRRVWRDGLIRNLAGTGSPDSASEGTLADKAGLRNPSGVCADRSGVIYIVDTGNHRVLRVPAGGLISTVAGNGAPGDAGDGGRAELAQITYPDSCAVDGAGNLLIADTGNHRIRKVTPAGVISTVAGSVLEGLAGDDGPATTARLRSPRGISVDSEGGILIADTGNHRIRRIAPDGIISTIAGADAPGFSGDGGPATLALLHGPLAVLPGAPGEIFVADTGNNRIRKLTLEELPPAPVELPPDLTVANAASERTGPVAPGEIVALSGVGLGPETGVSGTLDSSGLVGNLLAEVEVRFDGIPAPLLYAQASRVLAQVPYAVNGRPETTVEVRYRKLVAGVRTVPVAAAAPAIFPGVQNQDGTRNSVTLAAARGSVLTLYATGEGMTDGQNVTGLPAVAPFARPSLPVTVRIAGLVAEILYAGGAPGQTGLMQVDVRAPAGFVAPGETVLELSVGGFAAPSVALWLK
jgi:uncharacterized protein (TIGR03437 family)